MAKEMKSKKQIYEKLGLSALTLMMKSGQKY